MAQPSPAEKAASAAKEAALRVKAADEAVTASRVMLERKRASEETAMAGVREAEKMAAKLIADARAAASVAHDAAKEAEAEHVRATDEFARAKLDEEKAKQRASETARAQQRARETAAIDKEKAQQRSREAEFMQRVREEVGSPVVEPVCSTGAAAALRARAPDRSPTTVTAAHASHTPSNGPPCLSGDSNLLSDDHEEPTSVRARKAAKKLELARAAKEEAAKEAARKLERKEAKKERRRADAADKELAEAAAKEAERERRAAAKEARRTRPAAIRIQCAARQYSARRLRAELLRRMLQSKRFSALRRWRHLLLGLLRDVEGLRRLLRAAQSAAEGLAVPDEEKRRSRPNSVKEALQDGNWTLVRDSNHNVVRREVVKDDGQLETQTQTIAKTPSDHRTMRNTLASLRRHDDECRIAQDEADRLPHDSAASKDAWAEDDWASPRKLIVCATFLAFKKSMIDFCWAFMQRKRAGKILMAELQRLKDLEDKAARSGELTKEEQKVCSELPTCRLEEKIQWLHSEMKLMIDRGQLTADEQQLVEADLQRKLADDEEEARTKGSPSRNAGLLRGRLEILQSSQPFVWRPKRAKEIEAVERMLAELAEIESSRVAVPLEEVQKLSAKPRLLEQLSELKAASRGWFADDIEMRGIALYKNSK